MLRTALLLLGVVPTVLAAQATQERRVILVTLDGVRTQEMFRGMDSIVAASGEQGGVHDLDRLRRDYWRSTPEERRRVLMPFLWDSLVPQGMILGDSARGSGVTITNRYGFSAPGYQEILTGKAQPDVTTNHPLRYSHETVLEYVQRRLHLGFEAVAAFTSWENFRYYVSSRPDAFFVNAGFDTLPTVLATPPLRQLALLETRALPMWEESRLDAFTGAMAMTYMARNHPRVVFISMNDTDDLAHSRRYDRVLDALHALDGFLGDLWHQLQASPDYRGRTSLILTTDHGRGRTPKDWSDHGEEVPGSPDIWLAVIGPDTPPAGDVTDQPGVHQADVAATLLACLGLDVREWSVEAGPPIRGACGVGR